MGFMDVLRARGFDVFDNIPVSKMLGDCFTRILLLDIFQLKAPLSFIERESLIFRIQRLRITIHVSNKGPNYIDVVALKKTSNFFYELWTSYYRSLSLSEILDEEIMEPLDIMFQKIRAGIPLDWGDNVFFLDVLEIIAQKSCN